MMTISLSISFLQCSYHTFSSSILCFCCNIFYFFFRTEITVPAYSISNYRWKINKGEADEMKPVRRVYVSDIQIQGSLRLHDQHLYFCLFKYSISCEIKKYCCFIHWKSCEINKCYCYIYSTFLTWAVSEWSHHLQEAILSNKLILSFLYHQITCLEISLTVCSHQRVYLLLWILPCT
jgi:hypothetical protein